MARHVTVIPAEAGIQRRHMCSTHRFNDQGLLVCGFRRNDERHAISSQSLRRMSASQRHETRYADYGLLRLGRPAVI